MMIRVLAILCVFPLCGLVSIVPGCRAQSHYDGGAMFTMPVGRSAPRSAPAADRRPSRTGRTRPVGGRNVSVQLSQTPLQDAVGAITSGTGLSIVISPLVFEERLPEELCVTLKLNDVTVETALNWITRLLDLRWSIEYGVVYITLPDDTPRDTQHRIYRVGDLMPHTQSGATRSGAAGSGY